ncbi:MAG TPA: LysE family translocator [Gemmatimonadales bacterium]|nr:LysE family translocator [Gemmatimonadales bacterium]
MTIAHALVAFTVAAGLLTITPGLDTALVLRTAAVEGSRRAMLAGAGICLGCLTWGFAVAVGLGALLAVSQLAYDTLRIVGACYLIWMGLWVLFRKRPAVGVVESADTALLRNAREQPSSWFVRGFLTNVLNPKVGVFYVTFLPQFVPAAISVAPFIMLLAAIHASEGMLWFAALTLATRTLSRWLRRPLVEKTLDRVTGAIFIGFGLALVLERRR